jgi:hypothetical protein
MNFIMSVSLCCDCIELKEVRGHCKVADIWGENFRMEKDDQVT